MPTFTDIFCGAGGSSIGLAGAGFELKLAANHWDRAIETHSANFRDAEHLCADVSNYDMRRLPSTDVLWASPICTELSPAGGTRKTRGQLDLLEEFGHVPKAAMDRTRATFHDVIRATEVHRYDVVLVENVVEVAAWELFDWWLTGMTLLGYQVQFVSVSAAHVGGESNPYAPQWRDRLYMVFTRKGIPLPDVDPRPAAWCMVCDELVQARQAWKRQGVRRIGKYGAQYRYVCPNTSCRHAIVEPFVMPAAAAIDWSDLGTRIGDRSKPLAAATIRRIEAGLRMFAQPTMVAAAGNTFERPGYVRAWPAYDAPVNARTATAGDGVAIAPFMVSTNHDDGDRRAYRVDERPLPTRSTKIGDGVVTPPFLTMVRGNNRPHGTDEPVPTVMTGRHHYLTTPEAFVTMLRANNRATGADEPLASITTGRNHGVTVPPGAFIQKHHGNLEYGPIEHMTKDVADPFGTVVVRPNLSLVIPYRRGTAKSTDEALHTVATRDSAALVQPAVAVEDCHFRMLQPREHLRAQRFPDQYVVLGNKGEQTMQAGNAVPSNVAQWLGGSVAVALGEVSA